MRRRACIVCGDPTTEGSRCPRHQRKKRPWVKAEGKCHAYGWAWQQRRKQVLREEPNCRRCGMPSTTVDHIVPKQEGGTDDRANLQGFCSRCHKVKTQQEAQRGQRRAG